MPGHDDALASLAAVLLEARGDHSRTEVARLLGVTADTLANYERSRGNDMPFTVVARLARFYGLPLEPLGELVAGDDVRQLEMPARHQRVPMPAQDDALATVAAVLRNARGDHSRAEVARLLGVTATTLKNYEQSRGKDLPFTVVARLARFYGLSLEQLGELVVGDVRPLGTPNPNVLPDHHKQILALRAQGMSYKEIAAALDVPMGTVMSRLHHARRVARRSAAVAPTDEPEGDDDDPPR